MPFWFREAKMYTNRNGSICLFVCLILKIVSFVSKTLFLFPHSFKSFKEKPICRAKDPQIPSLSGIDVTRAV